VGGAPNLSHFRRRKGPLSSIPARRDLAETLPTWGQLIAPVAERVAAMLAEAPGSRIDRLPTPLTNENRHAGRTRRRPRLARPLPRPELPAHCQRCGGEVPHAKRRYCDSCLPEVHAEQHGRFQQSGLATLDSERPKESIPPTAATQRGNVARRSQTASARSLIGKPPTDNSSTSARSNATSSPRSSRYLSGVSWK